MKKIFIILTFLFALGVSYAQESKDAIVTTEAERIIDKYIDKTGDILQSLAVTLKVPAERVYHVLIRQQTIKAWTWLVVNIVFILASIAVWFLWYKDTNERDEWWGFPVFIQTIQLIILCGSVTLIFSGFINPEYGAVKEILDVLN